MDAVLIALMVIASNSIFLYIGIKLGWHLYAPIPDTSVSKTPPPPDRIIFERKPNNSEVGTVSPLSAEELHKRNSGDREVEEEVEKLWDELV